ncbi:hypothetical protein [Burkholderia glumae]|uniref:hypothetical protein n=1 Tax=Burkholderia glumae TaxID=337 RepID=UPI002151F7F5|nr:hypothetical protein [Burkholderia glumae]
MAFPQALLPMRIPAQAAMRRADAPLDNLRHGTAGSGLSPCLHRPAALYGKKSVLCAAVFTAAQTITCVARVIEPVTQEST